MNSQACTLASFLGSFKWEARELCHNDDDDDDDDDDDGDDDDNDDDDNDDDGHYVDDANSGDFVTWQFGLFGIPGGR